MIPSWKSLSLVLIGLGALGIAVWLAVGSGPPSPTEMAGVVDDAVAFYASRPLYERTRPPLPVPSGLPDLSARTCGGCHREIYEEWQASTHRRAWLDDAQFQAELEKNRHGTEHATDEGPRTGDTSWICIRCHTPLSDQQPQLVVGLIDDAVDLPRYVDNPRYDQALQEEAITCAVCHVRDDGVIIGPYGDTNAPHPTARGQTLLSGQVCLDCHQAEVRYDGIGLLCAFSTGREWEASTYATEGRACPSCHMPEVERPLVEGGVVRTTRRHWFGGSLIPKRPEFEEQVAPLRAVYGSGVEIRVAQEQGELVLEIANTRAGHHVPTGDPERYLLVHAEAIDAEGSVVSTLEVRVGTVYDWSPPPHVVSDNRIAPGETLTTPFDAFEGATQVRVTAEKFRIGEEAFEFHELEGRYVSGRVFHRSTWSINDQGVERESLTDDLTP